jgi:hypothetical protein
MAKGEGNLSLRKPRPRWKNTIKTAFLFLLLLFFFFFFF